MGESAVGDNQTAFRINNIDVSPGQTGDFTGPGTGGIHHLLCLDNDFFTGNDVLQVSGLDLFVVFPKSHHFGKSQQ